jgi:hypothetical protein
MSTKLQTMMTPVGVVRPKAKKAEEKVKQIPNLDELRDKSLFHFMPQTLTLPKGCEDGEIDCDAFNAPIRLRLTRVKNSKRFLVEVVTSHVYLMPQQPTEVSTPTTIHVRDARVTIGHWVNDATTNTWASTLFVHRDMLMRTNQLLWACGPLGDQLDILVKSPVSPDESPSPAPQIALDLMNHRVSAHLTTYRGVHKSKPEFHTWVVGVCVK